VHLGDSQVNLAGSWAAAAWLGESWLRTFQTSRALQIQGPARTNHKQSIHLIAIGKIIIRLTLVIKARSARETRGLRGISLPPVPNTVDAMIYPSKNAIFKFLRPMQPIPPS